MGLYEDLQVQVAEAQLRMMKALEEHAAKLRALELKKAKIELDTAERLNRAAVRICDSTELPPIKLS